MTGSGFTRRPAFSTLPSAVLRELERELGQRVVSAVDRHGGMSPGPAAAVTLAGGRRVFVKATDRAVNPRSADLYEAELDVLRSLDETVPHARLVTGFGHGSWVGVVTELVDGDHPGPPWSTASVDATLTAIDSLGSAPAGLPPLVHRAPALDGWRRLAAEPGRLDGWERERVEQFADLETGWQDWTRGPQLVHFDVRGDNAISAADGVRLVDWSFGCQGAAWVDRALLSADIAASGQETATPRHEPPPAPGPDPSPPALRRPAPFIHRRRPGGKGDSQMTSSRKRPVDESMPQALPGLHPGETTERKTVRRSSLATTAASVAVLLTSPMAAVASGPPAEAAKAPAAIEWSECGTTFKGECATIPVPIDWQKPLGQTFQLAIGRLKALSPDERIGVLFAHPGGPGGSGIDAYTIGRQIPDASPLRKYFDIVTVDPRGVKRSNPVMCTSELVHAAPTAFPADEAAYQALLEYNNKLGQDCRKHTGPLFDHVDTISATRDVDAIRAALGEQKMSFYGASYGTQVGQQYAEMFPSRIRAMTLDSNMDHSITSAYEYLRTITEDQEQSFLEFAGWCDRTPTCALHDRNAIKVWDDLHAKAEAGTLIDPASGQPMDPELLRLEMFLAQHRPKDRWPPFAARLASLADSNPQGTSGLKAAGEVLHENAHQAIWCSDWRWNVQGFAQLDYYRQRIAQTVAPHTKISPFWRDVTSCLGWPGAVRNPQHRLNISGTPTILLTKSRHDVAAPKAWAYAVADQIENSVLLEYEGVGHGNFRISTCARAHIEKYLISLVTPEPGTRCAAEYPVAPPPVSTATDPVTRTTRPVHAG